MKHVLTNESFLNTSLTADLSNLTYKYEYLFVYMKNS